MNNKLFIYLTDNFGLKQVCVKDEEKELIEKELESHFNIDKPFVLIKESTENQKKPKIKPKGNIEAEDHPDALLIHHNLAYQIVQEALLRLNIKDNYGQVFLVFHTVNVPPVGKEMYPKTIDFLDRQELNFIKVRASHTSENRYYLTAINFLKPNSNAIEEAERVLGYQVIYDVWKELMLLKVKVKRGIIDDSEYSGALEKLSDKEELTTEDGNLTKFADLIENLEKKEDQIKHLDVFWKEFERHIGIHGF